MSFVKKAVKKVFKVVKKIGKVLKKVVKSKWFKYALMAAAVVFTAGVAAGGFAAFSGVNTLGGFFSAVGQTMATGFKAIVASVKTFGTAAKNALMGTAAPASGTVPAIPAATGAPTAALGANATAAQILTPVATTGAKVAGVITPTSGAMLSMGATLPTSTITLMGGAGQAVGGNILSRIAGAFMANTPTGSMLRTGLVMGIQGYMQGKQREEEEDLRRSQWRMGADAKGNTFDFGSLGFAQSTANQPLWKTSMGSGGVGFQQPNASTQNVSLGAPTPQQQAQAATAPPPPNEGQYDAALLAHQAPQANPAAPPPQGTPQGRGPSLLDLETMGVA